MSTHTSYEEGDGRAAGQDIGGEPRAVPDMEDRTGTHTGDHRSTGQLLRSFTQDLAELVGKEMSLARAEMREYADQTQTAVSGLAMGASLAFAGLIFVLLSITAALMLIFAPWLASLIVGLAALAIGYGMIKSGQKKMSVRNATPERTMDSLRDDRAAARRAATH